GYCDPKWISDFFYARLLNRVRTDNRYFNDWMPAPSLAVRYLPVAIDALTATTVQVSGAASARERWIPLGEPREITWAGGGSATAYFFPYDHLPGGTLYVPEQVPAGAQLHGVTIATILR